MGRKIVILGNGGTGKSTLGEMLSRSLNIPVTHLDQLTMLPGWKPRPFDEFKKELDTVLESEQWIVEGWSYQTTLRERMSASDTIIHLHYPIWYAYWNAFKRHLRYTFKQNPYDPPNSPIWKKTRLMVKAMWLVYRQYEPEFRSMLKEYSQGRYVYVFESRRTLRRWLRSNNWETSLA